jgi:hypothetical protein
LNNGLVDHLVHSSIDLPAWSITGIQSFRCKLDGLGGGFSGNTHLMQLRPVNISNYAVYQYTGDSNSNNPPLGGSDNILKVGGIVFIVFGMVISGIGWWVLVCGRLDWGLNKRLGFWFPANTIAVFLYWHGLTFLLGI